MLEASAFRLFLCFWSGPKATGMAMSLDKLTVQADQPTFTQKSIGGAVLPSFTAECSCKQYSRMWLGTKA
jgi:hypothetical protein